MLTISGRSSKSPCFTTVRWVHEDLTGERFPRQTTQDFWDEKTSLYLSILGHFFGVCMMGSSHCLLLFTCFLVFHVCLSFFKLVGALMLSRTSPVICFPLLPFSFRVLWSTSGLYPFLYVPCAAIQHATASLLCHCSFLRSIYSINGFPVIALPQQRGQEPGIFFFPDLTKQSKWKNSLPLQK